MEAAAASARPVLRVAAICGSLRKASFNRGLLRAAAEVCEDSIPGLRVDELDISDLPLINTDLETGGGTGFPPAVEAFRAKVCQADCFLFGAPEYNYSIAMFMSQASSSTCRTRRSNAARNALQPRPLAVVAASTEPTGVDLEAPVDYDTGLPLIICPDCRDVRVFAANTKSGSNIGRRYFKCPRKNYSNGTCIRFWFEEEYVVYLHDKGHLPSASSTVAAASTTEVHELVGKIDSLEQNVNMVKEMVGKNREGMGSCIYLVCGCVNVTLFLLLVMFLVVAFVFK